MGRLQSLRKAVSAYREGRIGDAAAYKAGLLQATPYPAVAEALSRLETPLPAISLETLGALEPGTLGRTYADHMHRENLTPLDLSDEARRDLGEHVLGLRYTLLHDLFHVLLGFDTSWAGELGVWEFVGAQKYCPQYERAARWSWRVYPLVAPSQMSAFRANSRRAKALAANASCIIAHDFTESWSDPLDIVRADLGLRP
ncbi:MAG: Coq4 family protein [Myxococcota bacterium]